MTSPKRAASSPRHHRLPPPLLDGTSEHDGYPILDEHPEELAIALLKTSRSTRLMAAAGEDTSDLFAAVSLGRRLRMLRDCGAEDNVRAALMVAAECLIELDRPQLAIALADVAEWALKRGATGTALEFFQLTALLDERSAGPCREAGKLARARGDLPRAEMWFRHGIHRGRTSGDWASATWSMVGLSIVLRLRGSLSSAETWLMRALRRARRQSLQEVVAAAYHEMLAVAIRRESNRAVVRYGRQAIQAYRGDARSLAVAHDIAVFWTVQGFYMEALSIFRSLPEDYGHPSDQVALAANIARCAGALHLRSEFDAAVVRTEALLVDPASRQMEALALGETAHGASDIGDYKLALNLATRALDLARQRSEAQLEMEMEVLLDQLHNRISPSEVAMADPPVRAPRPVSMLAREISAAMAG